MILYGLDWIGGRTKSGVSLISNVSISDSYVLPGASDTAAGGSEEGMLVVSAFSLKGSSVVVVFVFVSGFVASVFVESVLGC